ncbi:MAG: hypothetical protein EA384_03480 [Spirochaetaceae bacterium]|nr:MAG: hypothetical protein EA384_03480 [Spirochaetaceae bacterium]
MQIMCSVSIVYASRHGATRTVAQRIAVVLQETGETSVSIMELGTVDQRRLEGSDTIIVGGPVYAGRIVPEIPRFCESHRQLLLARPVGLFITCLHEGEKARSQLSMAYPQWLFAHACVHADLGGAVELGSLRIVDRFVMRRVARVRHDVDRIRMDAVRDFVSRLRACPDA